MTKLILQRFVGGRREIPMPISYSMTLANSPGSCSLSIAESHSALRASAGGCKQRISEQPGRAPVRFATSPLELSNIRQLRYSVYVEEQGRAMGAANHQTRELEDEFDSSALHLYVTRDREVAACVRIHLGDIPSDLAGQLEIGQFQDTYNCFVSKLIVRKAFRNTTMTARMICAVYSLARDHGAQRVFCTAFPHLVALYERLGMRAYKGMHMDKDFGPHFAMVGSINSFHSPNDVAITTREAGQ